MTIKLYSCEVNAFNDEALAVVPGFSHRSQPFKVSVSWYPFEEWKVRAWVYARNRTHAYKQLRNLPGVRDLDGGRPFLVPASVAVAFAKP